MTAIPVLTHLAVEGYGLYPGTPAQPGLEIDLRPGMTLVLGANGLGKTTLVTLLFRLCTGPSDLPKDALRGSLGNKATKARKLNPNERRLFAARVVDGAKNAHATLEMQLGEHVVVVRRSLADLSLLAFSVDGVWLPANEPRFQHEICKLAGVPNFGDWILLLRHLVFYFEDRRALVWDPTAQRHVLRLLFLPVSVAEEWASLERQIVELDSRMRNLQAAVFREKETLERDEEALRSGGELATELSKLRSAQAKDDRRREALNEELSEAEARLQSARLEMLKSENQHESAYRHLEYQQLRSIEAAFPTQSATARYLIAHLVSEGGCLACGDVAEGAAEVKRRMAEHRCLVCGSEAQPRRPGAPSAATIKKAETALVKSRIQLETARTELQDAQEDHRRLVPELAQIESTIASRATAIDQLVRQLPPEEAEVRAQREELRQLAGRVTLMKEELTQRRRAFEGFLTKVNRDIVARKDDIKDTFEFFARGFLFEECELVWAPHRDQLGEGGQRFDFAAFELEMSGASFASPRRRTGPEQVSESQREFVDLAFRMALMVQASDNGAGSLVIDAPESSLDAVFVRRAADVLTRFADPDGDNRLVVTSNLIEGDLIPTLARRAGIRSETDPRVVDLLKLAAPTAATKRLHGEYSAVRRRIFASARAQRP